MRPDSNLARLHRHIRLNEERTACPFRTAASVQFVATEAPLRVKRRTIACPYLCAAGYQNCLRLIHLLRGNGYVIVMIESPEAFCC